MMVTDSMDSERLETRDTGEKETDEMNMTGKQKPNRRIEKQESKEDAALTSLREREKFMQNQIKFQSDRTNRSWDQVLFTVFSKRSQWIRISQISCDSRSGLLNKTLIVSLWIHKGGKHHLQERVVFAIHNSSADIRGSGEDGH